MVTSRVGRWGMAFLVVGAAWGGSSGKSAEADRDGLRADSTGQALGGATPEDEAGRQRRAELGEALLDCARLTFASTERVLEVRLWMDGSGAPLAMSAQADGEEPTELLCPAEAVQAERILGTGRGRSWGPEPKGAWLVMAWCGPGLDGTGGACSSREEAPPRPAPSTGSGSGTARRGAPTDLEQGPLARASEPRTFSARRLDTDVGALAPPNLPSLLQLLDQALVLCLHSRQPGFNLSQSVDLALEVRVPGPAQELMGASMEVTGGTPAGLVEALQPCLKRVLAPAGGRGLVSVKPRYTVVAQAAQGEPGAAIQRVEVSLQQERVETSVPAAERMQTANAMAKLLTQCISHQPVEVLTALDRWAAPGTVTLAGTVDATRHDAVHVIELGGTGPDLLAEQARCAAVAVRKEPASTTARAEWVFQVRVSSATGRGEEGQ